MKTLSFRSGLKLALIIGLTGLGISAYLVSQQYAEMLTSVIPNDLPVEVITGNRDMLLCVSLGSLVGILLLSINLLTSKSK